MHANSILINGNRSKYRISSAAALLAQGRTFADVRQFSAASDNKEFNVYSADSRAALTSRAYPLSLDKKAAAYQHMFANIRNIL